MKKITFLNILLSGVLLLSARGCGAFSDDDEKLADLAVQLTIQAIQQTQTAVVAPTLAVPTLEPATLEPAETSESPAAAIATSTPIPCNKPKFQSETILDGTEMDKGESFVKSWRIKNEGTCTWDTNYKLVFASGDSMGGPASKNLTASIAPGEIVDIKIDLKAPNSDGLFKGYWFLLSDKGEKFGNYWVEIRVGSPPAAFAVTRVTYDVHPNITMDCGGKVNVKAEITTNAAGTVTYYWKSPSGSNTSSKEIKFDAAGKKIIDYNPSISVSGDYEVRLYIDEPNHQWFNKVSFHVDCT